MLSGVFFPAGRLLSDGCSGRFWLMRGRTGLVLPVFRVLGEESACCHLGEKFLVLRSLQRYVVSETAYPRTALLNRRVLSRTSPKCSCEGELAIVGEIRSADGWRIGFKLLCKKCGKRWTYSGGVYRLDQDNVSGYPL